MKIDRDELYGLGLDELVDEICELKQQLQSYKDKEDKLRELCEAPIDNMSLNWQSKLILAILNEGSDRNE